MAFYRPVTRLGRTVCLFLTITGCEQRGVPDAETVTVDSAGVQITTIGRSPDQLPEWRIDRQPLRTFTGGETGDSTALSLIGPVRWLADGGLVIADHGAARLLVYDSAGIYRRALGRQGAGPGELRNITSISTHAGDSIATYDASLRRLSFWHASTGFVRQVGPIDGGTLEAWPADAWPWQDSMLVVLQLATSPKPALTNGETVRRWKMRAQLTLRDHEGRVLDTSPTFNGMYTGVYGDGDTRLPFSNQPFVAVAPDRIYFGSGEQFALAQLTPTFTLAGELRWPAQDEPLAVEEVNEVQDEAIANAARRVPLERAREAFSRNFRAEILPANRPSIGRVLVDSDQRIWVERFEAQRLGSEFQANGKLWTVLAPDGQPLARLALPRNTRLEAIRGSRVAVVQRDSLDVQSVAVYDLRQP